MQDPYNSKVIALLERGVKIPAPESVDIDDRVDIEKISGNGVVLHAGCKLFGASTVICDGAKLGYEAPVTVDGCFIGPYVELNGGFFKDAVFLKRSSMGLGAHVRAGTILEEEAGGAHTVALKHTILFPFVTLGSLINFCDCLMAGGTSRKDHSEVGSSYIHFNYTPNQDKATPSLIGDVPGGVMLNRPPIFLGGQGGLVGPCRIAYGTVIAAGSICRKDQTEPGRLVSFGTPRASAVPFQSGIYRNVGRIVRSNLNYIANLKALERWYFHVRARFVSPEFPAPLYAGLRKTLESAIEERVARLGQLREKMPESIAAYKSLEKANASPLLLRQKKEFYHNFSELHGFLKDPAPVDLNPPVRDAFLKKLLAGIQRFGKDYVFVIQSIDHADSSMGTAWLQGIVDTTVARALNMLPSFNRSQ